MQLVRCNPGSDFFKLRNRIFDDFFFPTAKGNGETGVRSWNPSVDIYDDNEHIVIKAELPGVDKKDIAVDVKDGVLTLKGERSTENEVKKENYFRKETFSGKFERTFTLPALVNTAGITAGYKDGILKIDIPKPEDAKPKKVTVH